MEKKDLRIVYFGTPDFAVESLRRLVEGGYQVVGVVTTPDKPVDRHKNKLQPSPVKTYALEKGLPLLQPEKLKDEAFIEQLRQLRPDLQIVVAFRMLPEVVWGWPRYGTFNLHGSLLPQYRGAAPINWAIINGEKETGITTFFLEKDIDTGEIIYQTKINIGENDNFETIHDRLMLLGGDLVLKTVDAVLDGTISSVPQPSLSPEEMKPAPKIFRETCRINWALPLNRVHDHIRGLSPVPAAWTLLNADNCELSMKIFESSQEPAQHHLKTGTLITDGQSYLKVAVDGGFLAIHQLQIAGKKRMMVADFLRGWKNKGDAFVH